MEPPIALYSLTRSLETRPKEAEARVQWNQSIGSGAVAAASDKFGCVFLALPVVVVKLAGGRCVQFGPVSFTVGFDRLELWFRFGSCC